MYLSELIEELHMVASKLGDDCDPEIRIALQPAHPMYHEVEAVLPIYAVSEDGDDISEENSFLYIVASEGNNYLPGEVSETLGWR